MVYVSLRCSDQRKVRMRTTFLQKLLKETSSQLSCISRANGMTTVRPLEVVRSTRVQSRLSSNCPRRTDNGVCRVDSLAQLA